MGICTYYCCERKKSRVVKKYQNWVSQMHKGKVVVREVSFSKGVKMEAYKKFVDHTDNARYWKARATVPFLGG